MPFDPATFGVVAGTSVLAPIISKGIGSLFGLDEPSAQEREAARMQQEALASLRKTAEGQTASPAQLEALYQRNRTIQALAGMAQQGTAQQRAGNVRAAMHAAPEVMAQQGAIAAKARADEMARAREALVGMTASVAQQQAAAGRAGREYTQRLIGAGIQGIGAGAAAGLEAGKAGAAAPAAASTAQTATTSQPLTAAPGETAPAGPMRQVDTSSLMSPAPTSMAVQQQASMAASPMQLGVTTGTQPTVAPNLGLAPPSGVYGGSITRRLMDGEGMHLTQPSLQLGRYGGRR
jgi:hypothetical protein